MVRGELGSGAMFQKKFYDLFLNEIHSASSPFYWYTPKTSPFKYLCRVWRHIGIKTIDNMYLKNTCIATL